MTENVIVLPVKDTVPLSQVGLFNLDKCSITSLVLEVVHELIDQAAEESDEANLVVVKNKTVEVATHNHQHTHENGLATVQGQSVEMAAHSHRNSKIDSIISNPKAFLDKVKHGCKRNRKASCHDKKKKLTEEQNTFLDITMENRRMVTHSHQFSTKMFKQLNGKAFVMLQNCSNLVGIEEEPVGIKEEPVGIKEDLIDNKIVADVIHGLDGWSCTSCNYISPKKFNVSQHIKYKHLSVRAFNCVRCFKLFKNNRDLVRHEARCQGEGEKMPGRPVGSIKK